MKRLVSSLFGALSLLLLAAAPMAAAASQTWTANINQLSAYTTAHNFNVQYNVLSTEQSNFCVQLFNNGGGEGSPVATANTQVGGDQNTNYGNSGSFPVSVAADGAYTYTVVVHKTDCTNTEDQQTAGTTSTTVDTTAPGAPSYHGKTQSGNTYTLSFTAPSDADVTHVQIFTSTAKTYQAGDSTRVGDVTVSPNQDKTFSYTAPDGAARYFALEAFDAAGNGSQTVGDPGTVVNPIRFVNQGGQGGGTTGTGSAQTAAAAGSVLGATTTGSSGTGSGHVNAPGTSQTKKNGKVLGAATSAGNSTSAKWFAGIGSAVIILAILYYWFYGRTGNFPFKPGK